MTNQTPATTVVQNKLTKTNDVYMPQIEEQLRGNNIKMTEYQRTVVINAISAIDELLVKEGLSINQVDQSNITKTLMHVAALQLNAMATPREVYFIKRNQKNKDGKTIQIVEMGIEGDGNDALLSRFGRNVKTVHRHWEVREGDSFAYPKHVGLSLTPPTWEQTGKGKVVRVVYPIEFNDGQVEYFISEREDVKSNLVGHMFNNLMWDKDKKDKKNKIKEFADKHTLDEVLDSEEMQTFGNISPAWKDPHSRESMIVRKMRNNVVKKIPKDYSNAYVQSVVESFEDDSNERQYLRKEAEIIEEVKQKANKEVLEPTKIPENTRVVNSETGEITSDSWQAADLDERNFDEKIADGTISPVGEDDPY